MDIILCVTGSIAATECIKLVRELRRKGANVKCFMSEDACNIIHPNAMEFATGKDVVTKLTGKIEHVKYSQADLILVAPATANIISKFNYKIADNPISSLLITAYGHNTPILFVPSMHDSMYKSVVDNIDNIKNNGINFLKPRMEEGKAKFPNINDIVLNSFREINLSKSNSKFLNKKVLISLGGTYEAIDPIRGISNKSSGKMGLELAKKAYILGFDLTIIAGKTDVNIPKDFNTIYVESSEEMNIKTKELAKIHDIFIATAAVSDFAPVNSYGSKIDSSIDLSLEFRPTTKIIKEIKNINPNLFLVGFKAEYNISNDEMIDSAKKQIVNAGSDLVVVNDVANKGCGFGSDTNQVILVDESIEKVPLSSKEEIASKVWDKIIENLNLI
ncbi:MAG: bifunctional phosphopantothenoylcysteine decarboxylase/phosphopantothenate--cysteine ligase CoaBC [Methanobacteriaceae archaeon]